jgi:hypothetical protein
MGVDGREVVELDSASVMPVGVRGRTWARDQGRYRLGRVRCCGRAHTGENHTRRWRVDMRGDKGG